MAWPNARPAESRVIIRYIPSIYVSVESDPCLLYCVLCKDIVADALMAGLATAKDVPYFDGDFWPNTLEEAIAEEEKEKNVEDSIDSGSLEVEVRVCMCALCSFTFLYSVCFISAKWTEWMAEILFSFDVCLSVCLSVHSGPVNQTRVKWLKLPTSYLPCMFSGSVRTWPLKNFSKRGLARVTWPLNFWALNANSSKIVKATDFVFDVHVSSDNHVSSDSQDMTT